MLYVVVGVVHVYPTMNRHGLVLPNTTHTNTHVLYLYIDKYVICVYTRGNVKEKKNFVLLYIVRARYGVRPYSGVNYPIFGWREVHKVQVADTSLHCTKNKKKNNNNNKKEAVPPND